MRTNTTKQERLEIANKLAQQDEATRHILTELDEET